MNIAIITARAGAAQHPDKNMYPVDGVPLISYPIRAALKAKLIDKVYISTDAPDIANYGKTLGAEIIERPESLRALNVNHGDVIQHAVSTVDASVPALENIVVLLGNSVMIDEATIDHALKLLDANPDVDSYMTVFQAGNDHPLRALEVDSAGALQPFQAPSRDVTTEKEAYRPAYYFDQGAWVFRKECIAKKEGPSPWWWMGKNCVPLVRPWIQGRDIQTYFDLALAEWWVQNRAKIAGIIDSEATRG